MLGGQVGYVKQKKKKKKNRERRDREKNVSDFINKLIRLSSNLEERFETRVATI